MQHDDSGQCTLVCSFSRSACDTINNSVRTEAHVCCNLDANALSFAHIVLAYANFCSIKPESVMSNFPRHHSDFLIHFVLLFHLGM